MKHSLGLSHVFWEAYFIVNLSHITFNSSLRVFAWDMDSANERALERACNGKVS